MAEVSNVVLVHGAWGRRLELGKVIPQLEEAGLNAVSVQNPLTLLADDVAATKRQSRARMAKSFLVGHS